MIEWLRLKKENNRLREENSDLKREIKRSKELEHDTISSERFLLKKILDVENSKRESEILCEEFRNQVDSLKNKVREQTDNDVALSALRVLGIIPTAKEEEKKTDNDRLSEWMAKHQRNAMSSNSGYGHPFAGFNLGNLFGG